MALPDGWKPLIVCDGIQDRCDFNDLIELIQNGIYDMVLFSTLVVVAMLCYAGFTWLTSGGNKGKHDRAKGMLWNVVIGYVWILAAWIIVYTISKTLLKPEFYDLLEPLRNTIPQ